jgi:predicted RNA-binding protein YlxR (DUF448 family)
MICEFLPKESKKKLLEIASNSDLLKAGYARRSVYVIKQLGIMSDEKCEKLVEVLGEKAIPIIDEAYHEFENQVNEFKQKVQEKKT